MNKCVIIDDEPLALDVLETFISQTGQLNLVAKFESALQAFQYLKKNVVDIIFLDIEMPGIDGLELMRTLAYPAKVIITTAYRDYAVEGFDLSAIDYLVKPISFERFMKAIHKCNCGAIIEQEKYKLGSGFLYAKVEKKIVRLPYQDILWIEGMKDYIKIKTAQNTYITYQTLSSITEKLPSGLFIRVHKSYLVGALHVHAVRRTDLEIGSTCIPIGRSYRQAVMEILLKG